MIFFPDHRPFPDLDPFEFSNSVSYKMRKKTRNSLQTERKKLNRSGLKKSYIVSGQYGTPH